jgi:hypothetical protein
MLGKPSTIELQPRLPPNTKVFCTKAKLKEEKKKTPRSYKGRKKDKR